MNPDGEDRAAKGAEGRMRWVLLILGGLMVLMGGVWTLQGIGILPGSFMSGQTVWAGAGLVGRVGPPAGRGMRPGSFISGERFWAVAGLLTLVAGAALCYAATRLGSR